MHKKNTQESQVQKRKIKRCKNTTELKETKDHKNTVQIRL